MIMYPKFFSDEGTGGSTELEPTPLMLEEFQFNTGLTDIYPAVEMNFQKALLFEIGNPSVMVSSYIGKPNDTWVAKAGTISVLDNQNVYENLIENLIEKLALALKKNSFDCIVTSANGRTNLEFSPTQNNAIVYFKIMPAYGKILSNNVVLMIFIGTCENVALLNEAFGEQPEEDTTVTQGITPGMH